MTSTPARTPYVEARLAELASIYDLDGPTVDALTVLVDVFATDPHAATTIREPDDVVDRHIADGLTGLEVPELSEAGSLVDVGAGAGVPALVLAAARPDCQVVALDTVRKKTEWVSACAERMGLGNVRGVHGRAESWKAGIGAMDVVTARAVAPLGVLVEYASPLLRMDGLLVAWKGALDTEEWKTGLSVAKRLKMTRPEVVDVQPWPDARERRLVLSHKDGKTPKGFPRGEGLARRKPLA
ncbi:MAG: 16S rRNA (guanine(527)-N(7))-methyltransferase RsmG [Patulibacter sp.]|nr:16S rRNA (guanine(527)-N(7))-methyltransferase RsmG [Patulibacter sp.]